jgi:hypothetical protein
MTNIAPLVALIVVVIVIVFGVLRLLWLVWRWMVGGKQAAPTPPHAPRQEVMVGDPVVTASDLFAIRSNLGAVARQLEDLEQKLRLSAHTRRER